MLGAAKPPLRRGPEGPLNGSVSRSCAVLSAWENSPPHPLAEEGLFVAPQLLPGLGMVAGLLEVLHALWNVLRAAQPPGVEISQKVKSVSVVPVHHLQKLSGLNIVLLGPPAVGAAGPQVVGSPVAAGVLVIGPLEQLEGLGIVLLYPIAVVVEGPQPVGRADFGLDGGGQGTLVVVGSPPDVLLHAPPQLIGPARHEKGPGLPQLRRAPVEGQPLIILFFIDEGVGIEVHRVRIALFRPVALYLPLLLRLGRDETLFSVSVKIAQVEAGQGDPIPIGTPQPVLALGVVLPQIALNGVVAVKILTSPPLDCCKISPEVHIADEHLAKRLPMLRLVQHGVKGLLEAQGHGLGQLPVHHPAAQGQQRPHGAAPPAPSGA